MIRRALFAGGLIAASCALPSADEFARNSGAVDGGGSSGSIGDGGTPMSDDGGIVAPVDGSSPTLEAGADANAPCAVDYCATFSTPESVDEFNSESSFQGGGKIVVEDGRLHASIPPLTNQTDKVEAVVTRIVSQNTRKAVIELDLQVDHGDYGGLTGNVAVLSVDCIATKYSNVEFYVGDGRSDLVPLSGDGHFDTIPTSPAFPTGKLVHVRLDVDFDPNSGSVAISFDGTMAASRAPIGFGNPGDCRLRIQLGFQPPNPATPTFDVRYDNLAVDLQ